MKAQQYTIRNYGISQGLGQSQVQAITQDSLGYLWIGTLGGGVSRFDGSKFTNYTVNDGLASNFVVSLDYSNNTIFVGTVKGISEITEDSIVSNFTNSPLDTLVIENFSLPYIATSNGIFTYQNNTTTLHNNSNTRCSNSIHQIVNTPNKIWAATQFGLLEISDSVVTCRTDLNRVHNNHFTSVIEDKKGNIWIGSLGGGLTKLLPDGSRVNYSRSKGLLSYDISCLFIDSENTLWIGSSGQGVSKFDGKHFVQITQKNGLANDFVNTIFEDKLGNLWFGTSNGLSKYEGEKYVLHDNTSFIPNGGAYNVFQSYDSTYWHGTIGGGLSQTKGTKSTYWNSKNGFTNARVKVIFEAIDSTLWIGTDGKGVYKYVNKRLQKQPLGNVWVRDIQQDTSGAIYIATLGNGLIKIDSNNTEFITIGETKKSNRINKIILNSAVTLATDDGAFLYKNDSVTPIALLPKERFSSLSQGENGTFYFGNIGKGIYTLKNNTAQYITSKTGLSSNNVYALFSENDKLWVGTEKGLDEFILDSENNILHHTKHTIKEGFLGIEILRNSIYKDFDNNYWFGTVGGMVKYTPTEKHVTEPPNLVLNNIELFYEPISDKQVNDHTYEHSQNHFTFRFSGVDINSDQLHYRWRLVGHDDIWNKGTPQNFATYANLASGDYKFEVESKGKNKNWSSIQSYRFIISPPYWETTWFRFLMVLLGLILLITIPFLIVRYISNKNKAKNEEQRIKLKMVELEQQALRLQMNPHFLFNSLNAIKGAVAQQQTKEAKRAIDQFAKLMRSMLENTQQGFIELSKEIKLIEQYLELELLNHEFVFEIKTNENLNYHIPAMMIQPLVENAVLHGVSPLSENGKIEVSFIEVNNKLLLCKIEDNGIGREASQKAKENSVHKQDSKAMEIINSRLEIIKKTNPNIKLEIIDKPKGKGTIVHLFLPIKQNK